MADNFYRRTDQLKRFPLSGRKVSELDNPDTRELIYRGYRIIYRIQAGEITVLGPKNRVKKFS